jgi:hypothetical protein
MAVLASPAIASDEQPASFETLATQFELEVQPLLKQFCLDCHSTKQKEGELDLERFGKFNDVRLDPPAWQKVDEMLELGEMPPEDSEQLAAEQRKQLRSWVRSYLDAEARSQAGDPGPVVLRRLNNAEYTYTIRDLTGVELDPAREFPADGAAGEGFTNTGNALVMSPALLRKYLDAGKEVASHAVLLPDGFRFSQHNTRRDWTDQILARIRGLYTEHVDTADLGVGEAVGNVNVHGNTRIGLAGRLPLQKYFSATIAERDALASGDKTIDVVARERGLSAKYLDKLWSSLTSNEPSLLLDGLRSRWRDAKAKDAAALAAEVVAWQKGLWTFGPVGLIGRTGGPVRWMEPVNPLVAQRELRLKIPEPPDGDDQKDIDLSLVATDAGDGNEHDFVVFGQPRLVAEGKPDILLRDVEGTGLAAATFGKHPNGQPIDAASLCVRAPAVIKIHLPADVASGREFVTTAALDEETGSEGSAQVDLVVGTPGSKSGLLPSGVTVKFSQVTQVFSDRREVSFSRPIFVAEKSAARKRFESAMDEHRGLFPAALCFTQIVPVDEVLTLTLFYREDHHLGRLMLDDAQNAQLDRLWEELRYVAQSPLLQADAMELLLEAMSGNGQADQSQYEALKPLREPHLKRAATFRKELAEDEPKQVDALIDFASRAYRQPLAEEKSQRLRALYQRLRDQPMSHNESFRLTLARVLAAPEFLYRLEERRSGAEPQSVSDSEIANRLSYFLWSSMPDEQLRAAADAQQLQRPEAILTHTRRMLTDARVRRLAIEFACQWLQVRDFDLLDEKSEKHFPSFAGLREDMYEESIRFLADLFQKDRSILSMLDADHTFLNEHLAAHYGIPGVEGQWRRVEGVRKHSRGGILTQATVLSKQSGASRTNPILRGDFVFETLLGQRMPRPPKNVPELPNSVPEGLTERALIEQHSSVAACAKCHARIDPYGFALENFDAIGRLRDKDSTGHLIDTRTTLPDGTKIEGLDGLRDYLLTERRGEFVRQFCRKLLGYALGRAVQLSDDPLLDEMMQRLAEKDYRFSVALETIVLSDQFRKIRGSENN